MEIEINIEDCWIVGDLHGRWPIFNNWLNKKRPKTVISTGDFGFYPRADNTKQTKLMMSSRTIKKKVLWRQCGIKNLNTEIYWCKGNHEDHESISLLAPHEDRYETCPNVFYMPFGTVVRLSDGRNMLFCGGAATHNQRAYTIGDDLFPHLEMISQREMWELSDCKIDIVISHTCPKRWIECMTRHQHPDSSCDALDVVLQKYQPDLWYFSHFHHPNRGFDSDYNCKWFALNMLPNTGWFERLI